MGSFAHRFAQAAVAALLISVPLAVVPWGGDAYNAIKARLTWGFAAAAVVAWAAAHRRGRALPWRITTPETLVWAFLLAALLATWRSADARLSLLGAPGRHEGLITLAAYAALYFLGARFFGSRRGTEQVFLAAAAGGAAVVAYALAQPFLPPLFEGEAVMREWYSGLGVPRLVSTVGGPVVFGGYLAMLLPPVLGLAGSRPRLAGAAFALLAAAAIVALALTLTRGAWIGAAAGLAIFALLAAAHLRRSRLVLGAVVVGVVVAAAAATAQDTLPVVGTRLASTTATASGSVGQRLYIWDQTLALIRRRPLLGWGPETLGEVFPYDRAALVRHFGVRPVIVDRAHNELLHAAVSVGIPGAVAYAGFWALVLLAAWRLARRTSGEDRVMAAAALGGIAAFVIQAQTAFGAVAVSPIAWVLCGAVCGWEAEDAGR
jgi:putative inorganic carbon (HCO3(-)) transporter